METSVKVKDTIRKEKFYQHPIHEVWRAISEQGAISEWFIQADFKAEVGYRYKFTHDSTVVTGEVLETFPPTLLVYTWIVGDTTTVTTVKWILTEQDHGTLLTIEHSGFLDYKNSAVEMIEASVHGWDKVAGQLERYLDGQ